MYACSHKIGDFGGAAVGNSTVIVPSVRSLARTVIFDMESVRNFIASATIEELKIEECEVIKAVGGGNVEFSSDQRAVLWNDRKYSVAWLQRFEADYVTR